jgi:SAM-dependent methyltransferase
MTGPPPEVRRHYEEEIVEADRLTQGAGQLELLRTQEIIRSQIPAHRLTILDVGGAAGIHATWLAEDGHSVHIIDPVARHIEQAGQLAGAGRAITAEIGDARRLPVADDSADVVLLLGPLYHLTDRSDRVLALEEAARVVKPGGLVFVAAISRFASLCDGLSREFLFDRRFRSIVGQDLLDGQHRNPDRTPHWFTTAYFHHPSELPEEAIDAGSSASRCSASRALRAGSRTSSNAGITPPPVTRSCSQHVPPRPSHRFSVRARIFS